MTEIESQLMLLIERETDRVERLSPYRDINSHDVSEWVSRSSAVRALKAGLGIKVDSAWVGHDATARQARRRALNRLRELGLIELHSATGLRVTHVRIVGRPIPQPARPAPPPPVEHRPTAAELRHARLVAWSAECRAKESTGSEPMQ